jgi:murein L,D-transpeptidase YcbB/YkuD
MKSIKNFLFISVFLGVLIIPNISSAVTLADLQAQIQALLVQLQQLQTQLAQMQGATQTWCHDFNVNLKIGDSGPEINNLHRALAREGFMDEIESEKRRI